MLKSSKQKETREDKAYRTFLSKTIGLRSDPFPITAPHDVDYWADNKKVLSQLIRVEGDALMFQSSRLHVFFGPLGGGKSFAISYLANPKTRAILMRHIPSEKGMDYLAVTVTSSYPRKAGQLTASIYCGIFAKLFALIVSNSGLFTELRRTAANMTGIVGQALRDISRNAVQGLDQHIRLQTLEATQGYKCLNLEKSKIGPLKSQDDYVTVVRALVEPLLTKYQRIIIAIDELENLRNVSASERLFFNDFLRHLHQEVDLGLTIILVYTFNTFEDVTAVLTPAVVSRISERINFDFVRKKSEVADYITECLEKRGGIDPSKIIEPNAIAAIAANITKGPEPVTFRDINKELHKVFSFSIAINKGEALKITKSVYEGMKKAVPVDQIISELRGNR